jgi:4-hydroxyphenylpyruvate dioxygenase-like putative hemolysin
MLIDHICLAVKSINSSSRRICEILDYREKTDLVKNTVQDVNVQFLAKEGSLDIKLIEPASKESPLINFLRTRGEGLHHICFKSDDVSKSLESIQQKGARLTTEPIPGEAFDDALIAFAYIAGGLNIEIIDTDRRRNLKEQSQ